MSAYSIDIATNIENVLLFGVTRHASELLQGGTPPRLDTMTVLLMCTLLAVLDWLAVSHVLSYKMCTQRLLFAQVVVSIFSNTLLTTVASSSQAVQYTQSDWWSLLTVSQSTIILIVVTAVNPPLLLMLNVRAPPSRNCPCAVLKASMPPPPGPPVRLTAGLLPLLRTHTFMPPSTDTRLEACALSSLAFSAYNMSVR